MQLTRIHLKSPFRSLARTLLSTSSRSFMFGFDDNKSNSSDTNSAERLHKKYVPSRALLFNKNSAEGKLISIFKRSDRNGLIRKLWTLSVPLTVGYASYFHSSFGMAMLQAYSPFFLLTPLFIRAVNHSIANRRALNIVEEIYLLKNGDQIIVRTADSIYHKICIQDIVSYKMVEKKSYMNII